MTTSGSINFELTRDQIIERAFGAIGAIDPVNPITERMQSVGSILLNSLVKSWQTKVRLWPTTEITIPLAYPAKQSYTIGASGYISENRPLAVTMARRQDSNGTEIDVDIMSRSEYMGQPSKSTTGEVNQCYYDPQLTNGVLYVWPTSTTSATSLVDGSTDLWTVSGSGTGEYYYTGDDLSTEPTYVFENTEPLDEGTLGSLSAGEYGWGDNDALGSDTLYVRLAGSGDPDNQAADYVESIDTTPTNLIITVQRSLEDFDAAGNTPDFPQEWTMALIYNLAILIAPEYAGEVPRTVAALAERSLADITAWDEEFTSIKMQPEYR